MKNLHFSFILLLIHCVFAIQAVDLNDGETISQNNETTASVSCITADGDSGVCSEVANCNATESRQERLVNCGSVLRGALNQVCCPNNRTFDSTIYNYQNDPNCGRHFEFWNIVGGDSVRPHFLPWTVAIYQVVRFPVTSSTNFSSQQYHRFICGGTLVSNRHVISAAHCVVQGWRRLQAQDFLIKVGAHNIDSSGTFHKVENVWAHENYRSYRRYNDISLFKLSVPIRNEYGLAACLPVGVGQNLNSVLREGTRLTVAGWGTTRFMGSLSQVLKEASVNYINNNECTRNYTALEGSSVAYPSGIDSSMICAGYRRGGADSCQGDSGGPLMYQDPNTQQVYLVGVVSFGYKCAIPGYPGIYTRVSTYLNWIISAMRR